MKVAIIGSGNVAEAFARAMNESGTPPCVVVARNRERGKEVAHIGGTRFSTDYADVAEADLCLIAVSDKAVKEVAAELSHFVKQSCVVAHTAGSCSLEELGNRNGRAVIYPFQTFTKGRTIDFSRLPIFIEGDTKEALAVARLFAEGLSSLVAEADSTVRGKIHLAGVFASNFANRMFACATDIVREAGLSFEVLAPLLAETTAKAICSANPESVQTGPAVRGDKATRERHMTLLNDDKDLQHIYEKISDYIWQRTSKND